MRAKQDAGGDKKWQLVLVKAAVVLHVRAGLKERWCCTVGMRYALLELGR